MTWFGGDMTGFWVLTLVSGIVGLVITIGLVVLIVLGIRWLIRQEQASRYRSSDGAEEPLEILRRRYASGEMDEEEYERRRRTLSG
jgi:putative membrane protein